MVVNLLSLASVIQGFCWRRPSDYVELFLDRKHRPWATRDSNDNDTSGYSNPVFDIRLISNIARNSQMYILPNVWLQWQHKKLFDETGSWYSGMSLTGIGGYDAWHRYARPIDTHTRGFLPHRRPQVNPRIIEYFQWISWQSFRFSRTLVVQQQAKLADIHKS